MIANLKKEEHRLAIITISSGLIMVQMCSRTLAMIVALVAISAFGDVAHGAFKFVHNENNAFSQRIHWDDMGWTIALRFSPNSDDVFAAEKTGHIRWYENIGKQVHEYVTLAKLPAHHFDDRGLLGFAVHPEFPTMPYLYALYTYGKKAGASWIYKQCPVNPFIDPNGLSRCAATQKLVRLHVNPATKSMIGEPHTLMSGWCTVGTSHAVGDLKWAVDGSLLLSAGDGSTYQTGADVGIGAASFTVKGNRVLTSGNEGDQDTISS